jgi:hypothetical protein
MSTKIVQTQAPPRVARTYDLSRFGGKDQGSESNSAKHLTAEIAEEIREEHTEIRKIAVRD